MAIYERRPIPQDIQLAMTSFLDDYERKHVLLRTDRVLILNKPAGIAMTDRSAFFGTGMVEVASDIEDRDLKPVNRLDRDTSGVVVLALDRNAAACISKQFQKRSVEKSYLALLHGALDQEQLEVNASLKELKTDFRNMHVVVSKDHDAKQARTGYNRLALLEDGFGNYSTLAAIKLYTGRTHQIRVHSQFLGHPIIGDSQYGSSTAESRQLLHSHITKLVLPEDQLTTTVVAPMPLDFWKFIADRKVLEGQANLEKLAA